MGSIYLKGLSLIRTCITHINVKFSAHVLCRHILSVKVMFKLEEESDLLVSHHEEYLMAQEVDLLRTWNE